MADLFEPAWELEDLDVSAFEPYAPPVVSPEEKKQVWDAYRGGRPSRVPMGLAMHDRVTLLDDRFATGDLSYEQTFTNPEAMVRSKTYWKYACRKTYFHFCDESTELPDSWDIDVSFQNIGEAWYFGCPVSYCDHQVPDITPAYEGDKKRAIFDVDIDDPLKHPPYSTTIAFYEAMVEYVSDKTFLDRPIVINQPAEHGMDGPLTVAMSVRGPEILTDLFADPDYAQELFAFLIDAGLKRRKAFADHFGVAVGPAGFADDSIAMLSVDQYRDLLLPHHRRWYDEVGHPFGERSMHLCGDATRHFPLIKEELGVSSFDTGFPVDFTWIREVLGPEVEIQGGVEVGLLTDGTPEKVYARSRDILTSGIKQGGRFIFHEANNLPPNVPWANLAAMYKATHDFGSYDM